MEDKRPSNQGLKRLVRQCHNEFRRAENIDHYDTQDYPVAERKFVKYCLLTVADRV